MTYRTGKVRQTRTVVIERGIEETVTDWVDYGDKPDAVLSRFRTCYSPRIAVTADMIATGPMYGPLRFCSS